MRLRESTIIAANASAVWPFVADPALQADWNPKVVSIDRGRSGPVQYGERFQMTYRMSGREDPTDVEVTMAQPPHRVAFRHRTTRRSVEQIVVVWYDVVPHPAGVQVFQTLDLTRIRIPWPIRLFVRLIYRFGSDAEEPHLHRLKRLAEHPAVRP